MKVNGDYSQGKGAARRETTSALTSTPLVQLCVLCRGFVATEHGNGKRAVIVIALTAQDRYLHFMAPR